MKMSKTDTYHALLWFLKQNEDILWYPTFWDTNKEIFTDDEAYGFLVIGPGRVRQNEYLDNGQCIYSEVVSYSDLASCRF